MNNLSGTGSKVSGVLLHGFCAVVIPHRFALAQAGHDPVDGQGAQQAEVVHADQMQQEVPAQVLLHDDGAVVLHKQHAGIRHLIIGYKSDKGMARKKEN